MPNSRTRVRIRPISPSPATGSAGLARTSDSGRKRLPTPAARTSAGQPDSRLMRDSSNGLHAGGEDHVLAGQAVLVSMLKEEKSVRVGDVIVGRPSERGCSAVDRLLTALDFDERADGRLVDGDHDVVRTEFLAVLLVAEPDVEAELLQDREQHVAVGDDGFTFLAEFHRARLYGPFESEKALAALVPHSQHRSLPAELFIIGIEQAILLQPPAVKRCGAKREDLCPCLVGAVESQLDLALERHVCLVLADGEKSLLTASQH